MVDEFPSDTNVRYIKLGSGGRYAEDCIENGYARIGYGQHPHKLCAAGRWEEIDSGNNRRALKRFYEGDSDDIWITFHKGLMWWTQLEEGVQLLDDVNEEAKIRSCIDEWKCQSLGGSLLEEYRISGELLKVKSFKGTICEPSGNDVALQLINDWMAQPVRELRDSVGEVRDGLGKVIGELYPSDLELLVDLIFREGGLQRRYQLGGSREDVDLELLNPITNEVVFVQVKAKSTLDDYEEFVDAVSDPDKYPAEEYYFVTSKPNDNLRSASEKYIEGEGEAVPIRLIMEEELADWVLNVGLSRWLVDKASSYYVS